MIFIYIFIALNLSIFAQDYIVEWKVVVVSVVYYNSAPQTDEYGIGQNINTFASQTRYDTIQHSKLFETEAEADKFIENMPLEVTNRYGVYNLSNRAWCIEPKKYKYDYLFKREK